MKKEKDIQTEACLVNCRHYSVDVFIMTETKAWTEKTDKFLREMRF